MILSSSVVTVADSQLVLETSEQNFSGCPKEGFLFCDIFPQAPYAAGTNLCVTVGCMVLVSVDSTLGTASVGNEYQVVLGEDNALLYAFYLALNSLCHLFAIIDIKITFVTSVLNWKSTPAASRYFFMGRIRDSYWLYLVNFRALKSGSPEI